jgi:hypothetical protein
MVSTAPACYVLDNAALITDPDMANQRASSPESIMSRKPEIADRVEESAGDPARRHVLSVRGIMIPLIVIVASLTLLGAGAMFTKLILGASIYGTVIHGSMHLFDLGLDGNIPTWYASVSLLLCALLLFLIARTLKGGQEKWKKHWYGLGGLFLFLSIDETATFHERAGDALDQLSPTVQELGGFLFYSWVIIGGAAVVLVSLIFIRFTFSLPSRTRTLFVLAAAVFVAGGLGIEMVNAWLHDSVGTNTFAYVTMTVLEELLEMTGVLIFIYALLNVSRTRLPRLQLQLAR